MDKEAKAKTVKYRDEALAQIGDPISRLSYLIGNYDVQLNAITRSKQKWRAIGGDDKWNVHIKEMESTKGKIERDIAKELPPYPIWEFWLKDLPGVGTVIAAKLIMLYYYRNIPICKDCGGDLEKVETKKKAKKKDAEEVNGDEEEEAMTFSYVCKACKKKAKGDGVILNRRERRDFPTCSKWWAYMGMHTVDGVKPKRKKGEAANWSKKGRVLGFLLGESFNKFSHDDNHPYQRYLEDHKQQHVRKNVARKGTKKGEWSKGHVHNAAKSEAAKLFLSHFWYIARLLEDLPAPKPYSIEILNHSGYIPPYFWNGLPSRDQYKPVQGMERMV